MIAKVLVKLFKQHEDVGGPHLLIHDETTVCQSKMRIQGVVNMMGGQHGIQLFVFVEHQRIVIEPVFVVVHVASVEQERGIFCLFRIAVPLFFIGFGVSTNVKHAYLCLMYSKKASYSLI